jgi:hypothetical protein
MNGYYLYCIREKQDEKFEAPGLFENSKAFSLPYKNLEAIVSEVPSDLLNSDQIKSKAQNDLNWIKEKAQRHEAVSEQAMKISGKIYPVIPLRFGAVFQTKQKVEQSLKECYSRYHECLGELKGKQEWSVKVYLIDHKPLEAEVMEHDQYFLAKNAEIAAMPKGMAYFFQSELNDMLSDAVKQKIEEHTQSIFDSLARFACASLHGKLLEKEFTGRQDPLVLNAIYFINEDKISGFKLEIERLDPFMKTRGLQLEYSGPWPPFHFVKV